MRSYIYYFILVSILTGFVLTSIYAFQQPTSSVPEIEEPSLEIQQKREAAEALVYEGDYSGAIEAFFQLIEECQKDNLTEMIYDVYIDVFSILVQRPDYEFEGKLEEIERIRTTKIGQDYIATYNGGLAYLYAYYGELDSMSKYCELAEDYYEEHNQNKLQANLNNTLSIEMYFLEELPLAKGFIDKAEVILNAKLLPQGKKLANFYENKSAIYAELGENDIAIEAALKDIEELQSSELTSELQLAAAYSRLAGVYTYANDYNYALDYYKKALSFNMTSNAPHEVISDCYSSIGATHWDMGNKIEARKFYYKSLSELNKEQELDEHISQEYIDNFLQLASLYLDESNIDSVEHYILQAKAYQEEVPYRTIYSKTYHAEVYLARKDYDKANNELALALEEGFEIYGEKHDVISSIYLDFAKVAEARGNGIEALSYCQKALEAISLDFSDVEGTTNPELENVIAKGDLLPALANKIRLLKELEIEGEQSFSPDAAYQTAKLATETLEVLSRSFKSTASKHHWLNKSAIPLFEDAIQIAVSAYKKTKDNKYLDEAFKLSERSKSMLMADAKQEANASSLGGVPDSLIVKADILQKALSNAEKGRFDAKMIEDVDAEKFQDSLIFHYKHDLTELKHTFEEKYPKYYELKYTADAASIQEVQAVLDEETTFVEYFEGRLNIYVFTLTKNSARVEVVEKEENYNQRSFLFQSSLTQMRDVLDNPIEVYNRFTKEAHYFYSTILESSLKEQPKRLIIIPDGKLGYLPFEVLLTAPCKVVGQGKEDADFGALPYLIKDYIVSYNYSGTYLLAQQAAQKNIINGNILALAPSYADPTTPEWRGEREAKLREHLIELPGAEEEVSKLENLFQGKFFIGAGANESMFKKNAEQYGILHLAMHGLVDRKNPELSGLAMTEDKGKDEDNFLYAYEIKQLELNAGLVVLSACETGIGKYQRGEGVVSIGRGFIYAGAPALLMTLWSLNDQSGAIIIEEFYKNMSNGMPKDEAIRNAKLYYLEKFPSRFSHPFMWAAFIQVGDYSPITIATKTSWLLLGSGIFGGIILLFLGVKVQASRKEA